MKKADIIELINQTARKFESNVFVFNKLEDCANTHPDQPAIVFGGSTLSYRELNNRSNALAAQLIRMGLQIESPVVVSLDRSFELMVSIFGIIKAGGVYLPVLPSYPQDRILYILDEAKPGAIITSNSNISKFDGNSQLLLIDQFDYDPNIIYPNPEVDLKPNNLAYIIYTSGSTGRPKGVMIEHQSLMNRIGWMQDAYPINSSDVLLQKTSIAFDVSIWELFWWSFTGASLVLLPPNHEKEPSKLVECIRHNGVSVVHFVPSMFNTYLSYLSTLPSLSCPSGLKWVFCSGEELLQSSVIKFYALNEIANSDSTLVNLYGPTEATVDVTYYTCPKNIGQVVPIGKPIYNTQVYILNDKNEVQSADMEGELALCGVNLARGYIQNKDLTNQKFIQINVNDTIIRAYKTGDLAYVSSSGDIIYKGRMDRQIKLRGFRIELEEIENVLLSNVQIAECCCILNNEKEQNAFIACFYVATDNNIDGLYLKNFLQSKLPDYMIPTKFQVVGEMPLTSNGKLDKKVLLRYLDHNTDVVLEQTNQETINYEKKVKDLWCKLFNKSNINPEVNFFDLGGNSLMLVQMGLQLKKEFNLELDMLTLVEFPTIRSLGKYISEIERTQ